MSDLSPTRPEPQSTAKQYGVVSVDHDGNQRITFERHLQHPVTRVWDAITDPQEVLRWANASWNFDPSVGGAMELTLNAAHDAVDSLTEPGVVTAYEPPSLLEFCIERYLQDGKNFGAHRIRWTLQDDPTSPGLGCILTFSDTFAPGQRVRNSIACGWHFMMDSLQTDLAGGEVNWDGAGRELERLYFLYRHGSGT